MIKLLIVFGNSIPINLSVFWLKTYEEEKCISKNSYSQLDNRLKEF